MENVVMINADSFEQEMSYRENLVDEVLEDMSAFVSPPIVYSKINSMLASGIDSADDFGEVVMTDPNLTVRLLKLVNSSYYSLRAPIETVSRAITIIGMRELANLVCSVCAVSSFSKISPEVTNMEVFWRDAVYCGVACRAMAKKLGDLDPEAAFIMGLLHDVGTLVINHRFPELAEQSIVEAAGDAYVLAETERRWLGFDHASLGAQILSEWGFSEAMCDATRTHHDPSDATIAQREAALLSIADVIANEVLNGMADLGDAGEQRFAKALALSGLGDDFDKNALSEEIQSQFEEVKNALHV